MFLNLLIRIDIYIIRDIDSNKLVQYVYVYQIYMEVKKVIDCFTIIIYVYYFENEKIFDFCRGRLIPNFHR